MEKSERRSSSRVQLKASVSISIDGKSITSAADVRDISLDSIFIASPSVMPATSICDITITFTGTSSCLSISGKGRTIRRDDNGIAIRFVHLDMDSYLYLKNIVQYNQGPVSS
jgi:hypothetical protein